MTAPVFGLLRMILMDTLIKYLKKYLRKGTIRQRMFRLMILGSMFTFVTMLVLFAYGFFMVSHVLGDQSEELSSSSSDYIESVTANQITSRLVDVARTRANTIEIELLYVAKDTEYLANGVHNIIVNPQNYKPRILPDPRLQPIKTGEVYLHRGAKLQAGGLSPAVENEIRLMGNVEEYIGPMAKNYSQYESTVFVGSKNGYIIAADNTPGQKNVPMTEEFLKSYEPAERNWYKNAHNNEKITFNDIYIGSEGFPSFTCSAPYTDENGFAGVVAIACAVHSLSDIMDSAVLGKTGLSFVMNNKGEIMLSTRHDGVLSAEQGKELSKNRSEGLSKALKTMNEGHSGWQIVELEGEEYYLAYAPLLKMNWSFGTLIAKKEVITPAVEARGNMENEMNRFRAIVQNRLICLLATSILIVGIMLCVMFTLSSWLSRRFVKPINTLTEGVQEIANGNLTKKLSISSGDELEALADCFNNMTDELQKYMANLTKVTMEKEHIATELSVATNIQESMLPHIFPPFPDNSYFDIYATMQAAKEVGGDFYDFYMLDEQHVVITVADVSGKGVPAALFMVIAKTILKNSSMNMNSMDKLPEVIASTNNQLCQNNEAMMFVTSFSGVLDLLTGRFVFVNAGHNPPLIYRAKEKRYEYLDVKRNFIMGGMEDVKYKGQELVLEPGDQLFLYTDGVTEALNEAKELFGEERLLAALNSSVEKNLDLKAGIIEIKRQLNNYVGNAEQSDDITMLALLYNGETENH